MMGEERNTLVVIERMNQSEERWPTITSGSLKVVENRPPGMERVVVIWPGWAIGHCTAEALMDAYETKGFLHSHGGQTVHGVLAEHVAWLISPVFDRPIPVPAQTTIEGVR